MSYRYSLTALLAMMLLKADVFAQNKYYIVPPNPQPPLRYSPNLQQLQALRLIQQHQMKQLFEMQKRFQRQQRIQQFNRQHQEQKHKRLLQQFNEQRLQQQQELLQQFQTQPQLQQLTRLQNQNSSWTQRKTTRPKLSNPLPDLALARGLYVRNTSKEVELIRAGERIYLVMFVWNLGQTNSLPYSVTIHVKTSNGTWTRVGDVFQKPLAAGAKAYVTSSMRNKEVFHFVPKSAGSYTVYASVKHEGKEANIKNNKVVFEQTFNVRPPLPTLQNGRRKRQPRVVD